MLKLSIFLLFLILCYQPMLNAFFFRSSISVSSERYWYSVGDSVEVYCKTTDEANNDLYFSELRPTNNTKYSVKAVDKNTICLQLHGISVGEYNYICKSKKAPKEELSDFGVASFEVGYPPEIKNIRFESIDLKQLSVFMTPKRNGPNEYWKTTWILGDDSTEDPMSNKCLCLNASQSCLCDDPFHCSISGENCFSPNRTYQFNILGSNHFGLFNETYSISPKLEIVKLKELKKFETSVDVSSLSLSWSWKLQDLFPSHGVECKVSSKPQDGEWMHNFTVANEMSLKNLVPDTRYLLALQCKFEASNYWSDVMTVPERTSSAASNIGIENLRIFNVTDSDVSLSWKSPPADLTDLYYRVTIKPENRPEEFSVILPSQEFRLKNLNSSTPHTLAVALCNNNGCSRKKSYVQFTTKEAELCSQLNLTPLSSNLVQVNWTTEASKRFHFTIFEKTFSLERMKGFILQVPCPQHHQPLKLGIHVISENANGIIHACKMTIQEVTMCQNGVFDTIDINDLPQKDLLNVADHKSISSTSNFK